MLIDYKELPEAVYAAAEGFRKGLTKRTKSLWRVRSVHAYATSDGTLVMARVVFLDPRDKQRVWLYDEDKGLIHSYDPSTDKARHRAINA